MQLRELLLPEFDQEMQKTRTTLERVPEDKFAWQPHEKSMTLVDLTTHLANVPSWAVFTLNDESFDLAPPDEEPRSMKAVSSVEEALERFDKNVSEAREALVRSSNEDLDAGWTLLHAGQIIYSAPRISVFRSMVMNHMIHHRAQLGIYLRMNDVAVPSLYGPTADEA
ncbi:MAG: hypothetical protein BMS9Abin05_0194 [Rhodothermia bacterium]|nr:MAG: hypothetical protein BMS9Abin05_0194 [Rhodothermia bacterium]